MVCSLPLFYHSFTRKLCGANLTGLDGQFSGGTLGIARCGSLQGQRRSSWAFGRFCTLRGKSVGTESKNAACLGQQSEKLGLEAICCQSWGFNLVRDPPHRGLETSAIDPIHTFYATWQMCLWCLTFVTSQAGIWMRLAPKTHGISKLLSIFFSAVRLLDCRAESFCGALARMPKCSSVVFGSQVNWKLTAVKLVWTVSNSTVKFWTVPSKRFHVMRHAMTSFLRITLQRNSDES